MIFVLFSRSLSLSVISDRYLCLFIFPALTSGFSARTAAEPARRQRLLLLLLNLVHVHDEGALSQCLFVSVVEL